MAPGYTTTQKTLKPRNPETPNPKPELINPTEKSRKLEHGFRMTEAGIPLSIPFGVWDEDVPTFWSAL